MDNINDTKIFNQKLNNKLKAIIEAEFKELSEYLSESVKFLQKNYKLEADLLEEYSTYFKNNISLDCQNEIFNKIIHLGALESEINTFSRSLNMTNMTYSVSISQMNSGFRNILNSIKNLSKRLWQLLSQFLSLKEWSISGNVNINILGLSQGVKLQLTFQP